MSKAVKYLSRKLGATEAEICRAIHRMDESYLAIPIKTGSKTRTVYKVLNPLKTLQSKIKKNIFDEKMQKSAAYLHGGIPRRSIITNAQTHLNAKFLIVMDIKGFFPSVTKRHVKKLLKKWKYGEDVAELLSKLLTFKNELPQGSCVSPPIANLMLAGEPRLVKCLQKNGYRYSRYIDDIAVSSETDISPEEAQEIQNKITQLVEQNRFSIGLNKTKISRISAPYNGDENFMVVTGIRVDGEKPLVSPCYYETLKELINSRTDHDELQSIKGKISYVKSIEPKKGEELEKLLSQRRSQ